MIQNLFGWCLNKPSIFLNIIKSKSRYSMVEFGTRLGLKNSGLNHQPVNPKSVGRGCVFIVRSMPFVFSVKQTNSCSSVRFLLTMLYSLFTYSGPYLLPYFKQTTVLFLLLFFNCFLDFACLFSAFLFSFSVMEYS